MADIHMQSEPATSASMAIAAEAASLRLGPTKGRRGIAPLVESAAGVEANADTDDLRTPWTILDEASQELFRAESIVSLLSLECEASEHQTCAADIAGDFLRVVQQKLREAQRMLHEAAST